MQDNVVDTRAKDRAPETRASHGVAVLRALAVSIPAVLVGLFLIEFPFHGDFGFLEMGGFLVANIAALAVLYAIVFLLGQRTHGAVAAYLVVCFVIGIANHYVVAFKGQPVTPTDVLSLTTAADVASSYPIVPDAVVVASAVVLAASLAALHFAPRFARTKRTVAACTASGVLVACAFGAFMAFVDIERDLGCQVSSWDARWSYETQGTTLCTLKRIQDLSLEPPDGYSEEAAAAILDGCGNDAAESDQRPTVVAIMNESFSDLSYLPGLEGTAAYPSYIRSLADEAVYSGDAYASVLGAGTCNSEFEFLASATMAFLGDGVYPYSIYDLSGADTLVSYFDDLGYGTCAIHPAEATNWRRDRVYATFGFDRFDDVETFPDAEILRYYTTDRETYDRVLEVIEESDGPQFIFDVTLQNHGGYATDLIGEDDAVSIPVDGGTSAELDEFCALIQRSDADLAYFIERLEAIDEPVVVCFFGDHQPAFVDWPFPTAADADGADASVEEVQERYAVPYLIWANYDTGAECGTVVDTSLNYLASMTVETAGLPMTPYLDYVNNLRGDVAAINANGYLGSDGIWRELDDGAVSDVIADYAIVQYASLFD